LAEILFHPEALAEYTAALAWYRARSVRAATRLEAEVDRMLGRIISSPDAFPAYDDEHRFAVLKRFPYSIIYQVLSGQVFVIAVAHSSRAPDYWRKRS
jgi:hypothetical protein